MFIRSLGRAASTLCGCFILAGQGLERMLEVLDSLIELEQSGGVCRIAGNLLPHCQQLCDDGRETAAGVMLNDGMAVRRAHDQGRPVHDVRPSLPTHEQLNGQV